MWKVLIVDDEVLSVQFITSLLDWETEGFKRPFTALTVTRAQEQFIADQPDIVLMDIRMPEMDGLALSRWMLERDPRCKIIILTAYRDFSYAQQAISLGISSLLLKHEIHTEMLRDALIAACGSIEQERIICTSAIEKWLKHHLLHGGDKPLPEGGRLKGNHWLLLAERTDRWYGLLPVPPRQRMPEIHLPGECAQFILRENLYCRLLRLPRSYSPASLRALIAQYVHTTLSGDFVSVLYTQPVESLSDIQPTPGWHTLAEELILPAPILLNEAAYKELPLVTPNFPLNYTLRTEELIHLRSDLLQEWVLSPLLKLPDTGRCPLETLQPLASMLTQLKGYIQADLRTAMMETQAMDGTWQGFCRALESVLQKLAKLPMDTPSHSPDYAREAALIMRRDYAHRLTSTVLARRLHISEGYLRSVFKQEYGCTVKDYLRKVRLEMSSQMLLNQQYHIYEIARQCGFASGQHFSQVFKAETGMTPVEFRCGRGSGGR